MKHVTLRLLKVFESVSRHLSFSRAAAELHLTQPAVSMQVKQLEEQAGLALTELIGKKVFLTQAGEELSRHARAIARQLQETEESLEALKGVRGGRLAIGVISTARYFAPRLLAEFHRRHPGVVLNLGVSNRQTVVRQLADNEIDLAIMGQPPQELPTEAEAFADHPLVIVGPPDHPFAARSPTSPATPKMLAAETFLIREPGSGTRAAMERYFDDIGFKPTQVLLLGDSETVKQAVMAGLGIAFISAHSVQLECEVGRLAQLPVKGAPVMRRWFIVHRREKALLPVVAAFRDFLIESGSQLVTQPAPQRSL